MSRLATLGAVQVVYLLVVLAIGWAAYRRRGASSEDYFLGGRTAKTAVLFMALFGTNVTPFVLMGIPGLAYHEGVGVFGMNAAIVALGIPLTFYLIGYPAWLAARRIGAITPAELYAERFGSRAVGLTLFTAYFVYTLPYMVTAVLGVGLAVEILTEQAVSFSAAAGSVLVITLLYTSVGGMKATMWTNVFQGGTFLVFTLVGCVLVADDLGGVSAAMDAVREQAPSLWSKGDRRSFQPGPWGSWGLAISLTVISFPHMLVRIFAANDVTALKNACRLYPVALVLLWVPAVLFGVWGALEIPGLEGKASDRIFPLLMLAHVGPALQGVALAGILAAVMSTLDAQLLTLSSMLSRDVLRRYRPHMDDGTEVRWGRAFLMVIAGLTFAIAMARPASIFTIASFSFSGYVMLVPTLFLSLRWRRFTAAGAVASITVGSAVLLVTFLPGGPVGGLLPVAWGLMVAVGAGVGVSMVTPPPPVDRTDRVLGPIDAALG